MDVTAFHLDVAQAELEFTMQTTRAFTHMFGALNWAQPHGNTLVQLANEIGAHPLKAAVQRLAEWIDAYHAGTAARAAWQHAVSGAIQVRRDADALMLDAQEHENVEWLYAKWVSKQGVN